MADLILWVIGILVTIIIWLNPLSPKPPKEKPKESNISYEVLHGQHYYEEQYDHSNLFIKLEVLNTGEASGVMRDFRLTKLEPEYLKEHLTGIQGVGNYTFKHNVPPVHFQPQLWFNNYMITEPVIDVAFEIEYLDGKVDIIEASSVMDSGE